MIVSAAVKIKDLRQDKEIIIPCHRHCDAFYILKQFAYKKDVDYKEISQGFLDEENKFYNRVHMLYLNGNLMKMCLKSIGKNYLVRIYGNERF